MRDLERDGNEMGLNPYIEGDGLEGFRGGLGSEIVCERENAVLCIFEI